MYINYIGIYPDAIETALVSANRAVNKYARYSLDGLESGIIEHIEKKGFAAGDITNSVISAIFEYAASVIRASDRKVSYYVNCHDSHLYVDGEEM